MSRFLASRPASYAGSRFVCLTAYLSNYCKKSFCIVSLSSTSYCGTPVSLHRPSREFSMNCTTSFVPDMQVLETSCHFFSEYLDIFRYLCFGRQGATFCAAGHSLACPFWSTFIIFIFALAERVGTTTVLQLHKFLNLTKSIPPVGATSTLI